MYNSSFILNDIFNDGGFERVIPGNEYDRHYDTNKGFNKDKDVDINIECGNIYSYNGDPYRCIEWVEQLSYSDNNKGISMIGILDNKKYVVTPSFFKDNFVKMKGSDFLK